MNTEITEQFADEEFKSEYGYPEEYKSPKPIVDQIKALAAIFGLDPTQALEYAKNLPALPEEAEGWFAIPTVDAIAAKFFPEVTDPHEKYCRAVELMLEQIDKPQNYFCNDLKGEIKPNRLVQLVRTLKALNKLAETQKGDILIVAAQFGMRHRGRSVRRAHECFSANEFGLGAFAVGCMILTHPERYIQWKDLGVYCAGDKFAPCTNGNLSGTLSFFLYDTCDGRLHFSCWWKGSDYECFGSCADEWFGPATSFLPE